MHGSAKCRTIFLTTLNHPQGERNQLHRVSRAEYFRLIMGSSEITEVFFPSFAGAIEFYRWRCAYLSPGKNHATGLTTGLKECCYNLVLNLRREL